MAITINNKNVSGRSWGEVDKDTLRNRLTEALEQGVAGTADAIRECYAAIRGTTLEDTPSDSWLLPHHELNRNNVLVLNRGGMIAAAGALAGARAEPDLTEEQKRQAARHLLKHYRQEEVNLQPPQSLLDLAGTGEMSQISGRIIGEMRPVDIPLAPGVNLIALKAGDTDPMEVVVEIPSGTSARGWEYGKVVIRHMAEQVMQKPVAGYLGHQKSENLEYEFPTPVTHWVGAVYRDGSAFVRGVVDKAASDLKRWIRANAINQVSIYGYMTTEERDGKTHVTSIDLLSIDWVPLDRAGMNTRVVAVGEMNNQNKGGQNMTLQEIFGELRKVGVKPAQMIVEMGWDAKTVTKELGWKLEDIAKEMGAEQWKSMQDNQKLVGEIAEALGLEKDVKAETLLTSIKTAMEAQATAAKAVHETLVNKVIGEMVQAEAARPLVKRMLKVEPTADEAGIKKAVGELLEQKEIKEAFAGIFKESAIMPKTAERTTQQTSSNVTIKKVSI